MTPGRGLEISAVASVVKHLGKPTLPDALDRLLLTVATFDLSSIFGFPFDARPLLLHDGYLKHAAPAALDAYLDGAYLLDPFYTASVEGCQPGLWRMRDLAPDRYFTSEYYSSTEVHPCISMQPGSLVEEIGFLVPLECGFNAVYSLMRSQGASFSDDEMKALKEVEPLICEIVRAQWREIIPPERTRHFDAVMETAFASFCSDILTYHQQRIVQLILRGHSNYSIGQHMSITKGTVKIHRQNIYKRLNISSQRELFVLFVQSLIPERQRSEKGDS